MTRVVHMPYNTVNFRKVLRDFGGIAEAKLRILFDRIVAHCFESITVGSDITGAPGQPVKTGTLLDSWRILEQDEGQKILIVSNVLYAPIIEDNLRGATLRSTVGGFHSVKLTKNAFEAIVSHELAIVNQSTYDPRGKGSQLRDIRTGRFV
jgi:hypothetical protein